MDNLVLQIQTLRVCDLFMHSPLTEDQRRRMIEKSQSKALKVLFYRVAIVVLVCTFAMLYKYAM